MSNALNPYSLPKDENIDKVPKVTILPSKHSTATIRVMLVLSYSAHSFPSNFFRQQLIPSVTKIQF
ncbi:MAG: hypothetical protein ACTSRH_05070 [Promethearchaeota archaeon]